jgi:ABC-type hemin transport system ATPase subunit
MMNDRLGDDGTQARHAVGKPLRNVFAGVGYLRLGQPATELSGGEAQRIKLATELQRVQSVSTLYVLDEPTTGLHSSDVEKLIAQLQRLVAAGNTVVTIEHEMRVAAVSDWIMDIGPGEGEMGGRLAAVGPPEKIARTNRAAPRHTWRKSWREEAARMASDAECLIIGGGPAGLTAALYPDASAAASFWPTAVLAARRGFRRRTI